MRNTQSLSSKKTEIQNFLENFTLYFDLGGSKIFYLENSRKKYYLLRANYRHYLSDLDFLIAQYNPFNNVKERLAFQSLKEKMISIMAFDSFISDFNYDCIRDANAKRFNELKQNISQSESIQIQDLKTKFNNFNAKLLEKVKLLKGSIKNNLQTYDKKTSKSFQPPSEGFEANFKEFLKFHNYDKLYLQFLLLKSLNEFVSHEGFDFSKTGNNLIVNILSDNYPSQTVSYDSLKQFESQNRFAQKINDLNKLKLFPDQNIPFIISKAVRKYYDVKDQSKKTIAKSVLEKFYVPIFN